MKFGKQTQAILTLVGILLAISACQNSNSHVDGDIAMAERFEFSGGGAYHPDGFGEWRITLAADGTFAPTYQQADVITEYGPFILSEEENKALWELIASAHFASLPETFERPGIPDETAYTFVGYGRNTTSKVEMWTADAKENPALLALTEKIFSLIEQHTKVEVQT